MDALDPILATSLARRRMLAAMAGGVGAAVFPQMTRAANLNLPGGPSERELTNAFAGKREMILQRSRPPLLETPLEVFDGDILTPNDRFFVRWHWGNIPTFVDVDAFRLNIHGAVNQPLSLSLAELLRMPRVELTAVNQCSGNSRGFFEPRVPGAQWAHGAMGNAKWLGVSLRQVLDLAGVAAEASAVRFGALDRAIVPDAPSFDKSITIDHARDGEVMIAFAMNGEQLPLLNGFPLRLVVPGWYSTYWVKMLSDIEVLDQPDDHYWTAKAYRIPTAANANVAPGSSGFPTEPISRMIPRSWVTSIKGGAHIPYWSSLPVGGIALGGPTGVSRVEVSGDGGATWIDARLGPDRGKYSFRRWDTKIAVAASGPITVMARCTNDAGATQPMSPIWNPSGYMRGNVESVRFVVA